MLNRVSERRIVQLAQFDMQGTNERTWDCH